MEPVEVVVNGRTYAVNPFNPVDAFRYYHEYTATRLNRQNTAELGMKAIRQCITPEGMRLADKSVFEKWFSIHPEDLFVLENEATEALASPFFPQPENTGTTETE